EELYRRACQELKTVTVLANRFARGVSGNRNTGVLHTRPPIVAMLDDDARARPGWLANLIDPCSDASVVGTGGVAIPEWETARPRWFPDELLWTVGGSFVETSSVSGPIRNVWSIAMAVRREAFDAVGGFQVGFTKVGRLPRPEDTDLCVRVNQQYGERWVCTPAAIVDHHVSAERATLRYLLSR